MGMMMGDMVGDMSVGHRPIRTYAANPDPFDPMEYPSHHLLVFTPPDTGGGTGAGAGEGTWSDLNFSLMNPLGCITNRAAAPAPNRAGHIMWARRVDSRNDELVIFGGEERPEGESAVSYPTTMHALTLPSDLSSAAPTIKSMGNRDRGTETAWRVVEISGGLTPPPRGETVAVPVGGHSIYMISGYSERVDSTGRLTLNYHADAWRIGWKGAADRDQTRGGGGGGGESGGGGGEMVCQKVGDAGVSDYAGPCARAGCTLTADPTRKRALLFGGYRFDHSTSTAFGDLYEMGVTRRSDGQLADARECAACGVVGRHKHCSGCLSTFYCGSACAKANWPEHKSFCKDAQRKRKAE